MFVLGKLEMVENSLCDKAMIVITERGIRPTLWLGSLPVNVSTVTGKGNGLKSVANE